MTGEGCFDWQSLRGKVVAGVAKAALEAATPTVVIAGQTMVGRREAMTPPVGLVCRRRDPEQVEAAVADPVGTSPRGPPAWRPRGHPIGDDDVRYARGEHFCTAWVCTDAPPRPTT